jgi:alkylation response protein AidB-like acyl-CoA dehydrogenase
VLKLSLSRESEEFREAFKGWLGSNLPPKATDSSLESFERVGREWQRTLAQYRWLGVHWPKEYGGRGLSLVEEAILQEELVRVAAPQILGLFGTTMVGPVLIKHGSALQKERFLSKILSGEEIWCQGFSEPGAGSDLAAVKSRAERVDGGYSLSGQKIWTSFAHIADWCFVLCRTADSGKRHDGLSYLLVSLKSPGIIIRPLKQISGDSEFNEVFFDNAIVPEENLVGSEGDGWKIAISTLMFERVVLTFARQLQSEVVLRRLVKERSASMSAAQLIELARSIVDACSTRALAYNHLLSYVTTGSESGVASPGPEGSLDKLLWSESFQRLCSLDTSLLGSRAALGESDGVVGEHVRRWLYSLGRTIAAGTSEIQLSIIADRILGLPRV